MNRMNQDSIYNTFEIPILRDHPYQTNVIVEDLPQDVNIHELQVTVAATLDVAAGGGADGTALTEGIQRFISSFRVSHDTDDIVQSGVNGRDLYQLGARCGLAITAATNLAGAGIQTVAGRFDAVVPFENPFAINPAETAWPASKRTDRSFRLHVQLATGTANATSTQQGTGAFYTGGTRLVTFSGFTLNVVAICSVGNLPTKFLPRIAVDQTRDISAAAAELDYKLDERRRFSGVLIRYLDNVTEDAAAKISTLRLAGAKGSIRYSDDISFLMQQRYEARHFPAALTAVQTGTLFKLMAHNGKLSTAFDPTRFKNPRFVFNAAAPAGGVAKVRLVFMELDRDPEVTG